MIVLKSSVMGIFYAAILGVSCGRPWGVKKGWPERPWLGFL